MPVTPHKNDVLLGKGHFVNYYPGNLRFRSIADEQKPYYFSAKKRKDKRNVAFRVMDAIRSSDPPGRFLADSSGSKISVLSDGVWEVAEPEKALQKVLHRLRDNKGKEGVDGNIERQGHQWETETKCRDESPVSNSSPVSFDSKINASDGNIFALAEIAEGMPDMSISDCLNNSLSPHTVKEHNCEGERLSEVNFWRKKSDESDVGEIDVNGLTCSNSEEIGDDFSGIFSEDSHPISNNSTKLDNDVAFHANFGERGVPLEDDISGIFSSNFAGNNDTEVRTCREVSLRDWIRESAPIETTRATAGARNSIPSIPEYISSALLISSKITEILVDAGRSERNWRCVPLASIASKNILIGARQGGQIVNEGNASKVPPLGKDIAKDFEWDDIDCGESTPINENRCPNLNFGSVEYVRLDFPSEGNPDFGSLNNRLFALGVVFLELFAFGNDIVNEDSFRSFSDRNATSFGEINLNEISRGSDFSRAKKHSSHKHKNIASEIVNQLAMLGIPQALCLLIEDLLECNQAEFLRDDAYRSFEDVYSDLQLMIKEPSKFVYNEQGPHILMSDKVFGRDEEIERIKAAYKLRADGDCIGVVITGEAGVGKSRLAKTFDTVAENDNRRIFTGKFDQIYEIKPLSVIATVINDLCKTFAEDVVSQRVKQSAALDLENALGSQAGLLLKFLPNLTDVMTLDSNQSTPSYCTDTAENVRFLFCKTLQILSFHSPGPTTIVLDDVQWADPSSLSLISSLLQSIKENKCVFFVFCVRDNEIQRSPDSHVYNWYQSILKMPLKHITLANLNEDGVNSLVSDTLCLFPRLTRHLSQVLHHRALGNPFFVWQLLDTLQKEGYLYHSLRGTVRRWMWDMDKISNLRISDNVLELLMREMNKLPSDLKMGLEVASCMGATISMDVVRILSTHLKVDLSSILDSVTEKGFMDRIGSAKYSFAHDRVQQAAYEMMTDERRRENHMAFGLAICSCAFENGNEELLFTSVNQINRGGPGVLSDPRREAMIAALNLNVGTKSAALSDFDSALAYFKNGISFLSEEYWKHQYQLSIDLHNAAADASCALSDTVGVRFYSQSVFSNAVSLDDTLDAMFVLVKSLRMALELSEAEKYAVRFLHDLGEERPRAANDPKLKSDILLMIAAISGSSDDSILNLKQSRDKKLIILMKLYHDLFYTLKMMDPSRLFSVSLRMVQLSTEYGITELSPLAFAQFGVTALSGGDAVAGYRMGSLALKLAKSLSVTGYISSIIAVVQPYIAWVSEPFQIITETHELGVTLGEQWGDVSSSTLNQYWFQLTKLLSGQNLLTVRSDCNRFLKYLLSRKQSWCVNCTCVTYIHSVALIEGEDSCERACFSGIPTEKEIETMSMERKQELVSFGLQTHRLMRIFLFRQYDKMPRLYGILENLMDNKIPLLSLFIVGVFYEGLTSFFMARKTRDETWVTRGDAALRFLQQWCKLSEWNFENKVLLLQAEKVYTQGDLDAAEEYYKTATISAQRHKFIHEEAISHELAGLLFFDKKQYKQSLQSLTNSFRCFKQWGANAVAKRVEAFIRDNFDDLEIPENCDESYTIVPTMSSTKRPLDFGLSVLPSRTLPTTTNY